MTKKELIEAMKDLSDDALINVFCTSLEIDGGHYAGDVYFDDVVSGEDVQNEITICARF